MIFGSVINENLKDEIMVTVIATGFNEQEVPAFNPPSRPSIAGMSKPHPQAPPKREPIKREEVVQDYGRQRQKSEEALDIPTFLRNQNRRF